MTSSIRIETYAGKLNRLGYDAFLHAMRQARAEGHRRIDLVHWLHHAVSATGSDISCMLVELGLDRPRVLRDTTAALARLDGGVTETPVISEALLEGFSDGWVHATLLFGEAQIRTGHVLVALLSNPSGPQALRQIAPDLAKTPVDRIVAEADRLWAASEEGALRPMDGAGLVTGPSDAPEGPAGPAADTALGRFATDMTAAAAAAPETLDPIVGRDDEIRQITDVLLRRRQNNPILTGEAGVGKTAVVEGFAQKLAAGAVPPKLRGSRLLALDLQAMQAGAAMKGEFEQRLKSVIDEVQAAPEPIILFIDEAHTLIGAGGAQGTGDAANLLKPALARGTLRTIAATTWAEYGKYFEKDPALTRRFQPVQVDEPDIETCCHMLRGLLAPMEAHHGVRIADEAVVAAVKLSARYVPDRQLPDKAVSLLDTACARVAVSQAAVPARIAHLEERAHALEAEIAAKEAGRLLGEADEARLDELAGALSQVRDDLEAARATHAHEAALVAQVLALRARLTGDAAAADGAPEDPGALRTDLAAAADALDALDPDARMVHAHVDAACVGGVVSDWTGIPAGRMVQDEMQAVLGLADRLTTRVIGQDHGVRAIARRIETARANLGDPDKPIGVFMLAGPSGVGKTETALALADALYGGEQNLITIAMSEFQEAHSVSLLKGAPPGYVGYGEGGRLTEAVRRKPYSVVLLDEVEKAHPDVHELFFQVFDKGTMEDGTGRAIDFRNTLILLTSNVGTDEIMALAERGARRPDPAALTVALAAAQQAVFPPALLGRIVSIPYFPLDAAALRAIVGLKLGKLERRMREAHGATLHIAPEVVAHIVDQCRDPDAGGRMIDNIVTNALLPNLSRALLRRMAAGEAVTAARIGLDGDGYAIAFEE
ncbi:MAG: type VI secretion system ATPase TssH [Shimia sp.]